MYHTFQAVSVPPADSEQSGETRGKSRRISTSNACLECRRRKIRCNGKQPCNQCQWYRQPGACKYTKQNQRIVPSRALVDKLKTLNTRNEDVLSRIFPGQSVEQLLSLSREELLNRALGAPEDSDSSSSRDRTDRSTPDSIETGSADLELSRVDTPVDSYMPDQVTSNPTSSPHMHPTPDSCDFNNLSIDRRASLAGQRRDVIARLYEASQLFATRDRDHQPIPRSSPPAAVPMKRPRPQANRTHSAANIQPAREVFQRKHMKMERSLSLNVPRMNINTDVGAPQGGFMTCVPMTSPVDSYPGSEISWSANDTPPQMAQQGMPYWNTNDCFLPTPMSENFDVSWESAMWDPEPGFDAFLGCDPDFGFVKSPMDMRAMQGMQGMCYSQDHTGRAVG